MASPYSLPINAVVFARVRATNSVGSNQWGYSDADPKVRVVRVFRAPSQMAQPVVTKINTDDLKITWKKLFDVTETGGRDILEYDLVWDSGNPLGSFSSVKP